MKIITVFTCLFLTLIAADASAKCGPGRTRYTKPEKPITITLRGPDLGTPAFYWRDETIWTVFYFSPHDVVSYLEQKEKDARTNNSGGAQYHGWMSELVNAIKADLPLRQRTDLFKYVLQDPDNLALLRNLIADLLKEGKVTIDDWVFHEDGSDATHDRHDPATIEMVSAIGGANEEAARYFCTDGDRLFFSISYIVFD